MSYTNVPISLYKNPFSPRTSSFKSPLLQPLTTALTLTLNFISLSSSPVFPGPPMAEPVTEPKALPEPEKKKEQSLPFHQLFSFADKYDWFLMILGSFGAIIHGSSMPVFFLLFGEMVNGFGKNQSNFHKMTAEVSKYALYFVYLGLIVCFSSYAEIACWMYTGERQVSTLRKKYLEAVLKQDVGFFDTDARTGDVVFSVSTDTLLVQDAISEKVGNFIHYLSTFLAGLVVGFVSAWRLALLSIAVIPGIAFAGGLYAYTLTGLTSKSRESYANAGIIAEQAIAQVRTVYSYVGESKALNSYSDSIQNTLKIGYKAGMAKGLGLGCTYGIACMSWALVFWYAGVFIRNGQTDGGKAFTAIFSAIVGGMSLGQSFSNLGAFSKGKAAGYKLMEIIKQKPTIIQDPLDGKCLGEVNGNIEFKDVSFSYPSRPDVMIFRDFSIFFPAGKTVAVVGGSGSGKSTVVSLIERFYDPNQGQVLLDNVDIKTLQLKWLRDQIGLVNQEPALFATTIYENILYGKPDATTAEVEAAAAAANAHSFITLLPNGYDTQFLIKTQVGERGLQLSGGQKQRIAIARAMLKNPKILLLDEATSALDAGSESIVQEALDRLMVGRTTVVVAHRLSTIRNVDSIAVIQQGQVVETGTHDELITKSGAYSSLIRFQEMVRNREFSNPSTRRTRSSRLSHSLSTKSLSLRSGSLRNLSYSYSTGADGRIEMVSNAETDRKNPAPDGYFLRLLKLNGPEWPYSIMGAVGSVLSGFISPTFAIVMSNMIEVFYYRNSSAMERKIKEFVFIYIGIGVYAVVAYLIQHYFFTIMGENLTTRVRRMMLAAILRNEVGWFDEEEHNSSLVAARLATDAADVKSAIAERISVILQNMTSLFTSFIVAFIVEWRVSLLILAAFPLLVLANMAQQLSLKGFAGDTAKAHAKTSMIAGEGVSNIRTVAAFNAQDKILSLFRHELRVPQRQSLRRSQTAGILFGISQLALYASEALVLWYGVHLVSNGGSTFSKVIKVFVVLVVTANSVAETVSLAPEIVRGGESIGSVFSILDRPTRIDPDDPEAETVETLRGEIELRHVDFAYPSRPDVMVFKDLNLRIRAGQSQALVGASGSGKSSVIALIERFYDPLTGKVMIDGKDIRRLNLQSLRLKIGLVQQEPALFAASIFDNIAYGKDGATESEVIEAARAANVHGFVSGLPDGYNTPVGERGVQLSGGQKQRIAIARAVLKDPTILLLDEATSALDAESECVLQEALERLMRGRTTVVVAHRLSTIRSVDSIGVVQDGRIVEQGSHNELLSRAEGAYSRLLQLQHQHI
uniref:ABC transporter B family member 19 n=1 Tax=Cucumis melo TaxID=3656 RepID=A0A9I9DPG3_CUCME